jgi:HK97 family phage prohead protease
MTIERRNLNNADNKVEMDSRMIKGYAAVFNTFYPMWEGYNETIAKGAFEGCDMSDVVALFNHEDENLLARTKDGTGTLILKVDDKGLFFEFESPNTTIGNDVLENIKLQNIRGCSFAFTVSEQMFEDFEDGTSLRTIQKIGKLYDVGPVVNPAYSSTEIQAYKREIESRKKPINPPTPHEGYYLAQKFKYNL